MLCNRCTCSRVAQQTAVEGDLSERLLLVLELSIGADQLQQGADRGLDAGQATHGLKVGCMTAVGCMTQGQVFTTSTQPSRLNEPVQTKDELSM
jgi:hypothetical protein